MKSASSWTEHWSSSGHDRRPNRMAAKTRSISRAIAAVCAGAACVAALAGCGTSTAGNVTLEFFQYKVEAVSQFKKLVKGFEAEHPNITIDIINTADAATDLRTRFVKNKVPDVLTVDGGRYFGEFAAAGIFQDFTDDEILDNINPQMVKLLKDLAKLYDTSADRAYGIPFAGNANGYVVNVDLWRQAGLDPDNLPETWSEFIAAMKQIQQAGITPIEGSLAEPWTTQAPFASLAGTLVPISEYSKLSGGTATFADLWGPVAEKEVEFYQYTQDNPGVTYQQATQDFANGKAAILPLGTYVVPQVRMVNPDINVKFAQLPATDDPDEQVLTAGDDTVLTISATTKHPKESRMFVEFLMDEDRLKEYAESQFCFTPFKDTYAGDEALQNILHFYKEGRIADFADHYIPSSMTMAGSLQSLLTTGNVEAFTNSMQTQWDQIQARTVQ